MLCFPFFMMFMYTPVDLHVLASACELGYSVIHCQTAGYTFLSCNIIVNSSDNTSNVTRLKYKLYEEPRFQVSVLSCFMCPNTRHTLIILLW